MLSQTGLTLRIVRLSEQHDRLRSKGDWTVRCCDRCRTVSKIPLELVYIVGTFATTSGVLAVYRVDTEPSRTDAQNEAILEAKVKTMLETR